MSKPLLFLDVDGVLNLFGAPEATKLDLSRPVRVRSRKGARKRDRTWTAINAPHGVSDRLRRLSGAFDMRWATSWPDVAVLHEALGLGKPLWPSTAYHRHKLPACAMAAMGRRWAVVDDYVHRELEGLRGPFRPDMSGVLLIAPRVSEGLTDGHVDELLRWAEA